MSDRDQYEFHLAKMQEAFAKNDSAEMKKHWAKVEAIKNQHGGMPPQKP